MPAAPAWMTGWPRHIVIALIALGLAVYQVNKLQPSSPPSSPSRPETGQDAPSREWQLLRNVVTADLNHSVLLALESRALAHPTLTTSTITLLSRMSTSTPSPPAVLVQFLPAASLLLRNGPASAAAAHCVQRALDATTAAHSMPTSTSPASRHARVWASLHADCHDSATCAALLFAHLRATGATRTPPPSQRKSGAAAPVPPVLILALDYMQCDTIRRARGASDAVDVPDPGNVCAALSRMYAQGLALPLHAAELCEGE